MADNAVRYGFRWSTAINGHACPKGVPMDVASGQVFTFAAATAGRLQAGDPISRIAGGTIDHTDPGAAVGNWGIVIGIGHDGKVFNSSFGTTGALHPTQFVASGIVPPSTDERTIVLVVQAGGVFWEIDAAPALTAGKSTYADWQAVFGLNADHVFTAPAASDLDATPELGISVAAPGAAMWRIERLSPNQSNEDLSGENVKLIVSLNEGQAPPYLTASI